MNEAIVSLQNRRVKDAVRLRDRRGREQQQRMIIDGIREIGRAALASLTQFDLFVCEDLMNAAARQVAAQAQASNAELIHVSKPVFEKLAFGKRSEGIVATASIPSRTLDTLQLPDNAVIAVLEGIEKPGNVGAMLRSADAAGINAVMLADAATDLFNPNAIRASQGAVFTLPMAVASARDIQTWLQTRNYQVLAARVDAEFDYRQADYNGPTAILLGSEAEGISPAWKRFRTTDVRLPMRGQVDSLNVSVTAGVLFYEAMREQE